MFMSLPARLVLRNGAAHTKSINGTPSKPKKEKKWMPKISKEQLLDMRTKHEYEGWSVKMIMEHFEIDYSSATRYLNYQTQRDLIPKKPEKQ